MRTARGAYAAPIAYEDCLEIWRSGNWCSASERRSLCVPSRYGLRPARSPQIGRAFRWGVATLRVHGGNDAGLLVRPASDADQVARDPGAFVVAIGAGPMAPSIGDVFGEMRRRGEGGIGEHWRLTGSAYHVSYHADIVVPMEPDTREQFISTPSSTAIVNEEAPADELAVLPGPGPEFNLVAVPVAGNRLPGSSTPHDGTIMLPDGSFLTNVYRVRALPRDDDSSCSRFVALFDEPVSALSRAPGSGRRSAAWRALPGALAIAATGAAVLRGK